MKYHSYILNKKQKINQKLKELDEQVLVLKKSIENDRRNTKLGKSFKGSTGSKPMEMASLSSRSNPIKKPYLSQYSHNNRKILDNLSSSYNTKVPRNTDNYQRNKAFIMIGIAMMIIIWVVYNFTH